MATDYAQILAAGTAAAPLSYTVPNAQELVPLAVNADVDGTAAAATYVPTLEIVSDGGVVIARIPTTQQVAAGGSAEVTWAPFLRGREVSAPPSGTPAVPSILYDFTLSADAASIDTFTDGPYAGLLSSAFFLLEVWYYLRTDEATTGSSVNIRVNNDAGANYDRLFVSGFTNVASPAGTTSVGVTVGSTFWQPAAVCGAASTANEFSVIRMSIPGYSVSTGWKTVEAQHAHPNTVAAVNPTGLLVAPQVLSWRSTAAINRISLFPNTGGVKLKAGSRLLVYGR